MKLFKKIGILSLACIMFVATAIFSFGCCGQRDWNEIRLNEVTHSIFYAPLYIAMTEGFFSNQGISVSLTNGGGSNVSMNALLSGSADVILAGPETVVYTQKEGISDAPVVFGQLTTCDGSFIVSKEKIEHFTLDNLKGKSIIGGRPGGMPAMTLNYILETRGYKIGSGEDEVNIRNDVDFNSTASVWAGDSSIDFCALFEPVATTTAKLNENYQVVASLGELSGRIPYTCFAARGSYLANHTAVAEKFITGVLKGYQFIKNNTVEVVATALMKSFEGMTKEEMIVAVEQYKKIGAWSEDMILTQESFDNLMNVLLHAKTIDSASNWADVVDNTIPSRLKPVA